VPGNPKVYVETTVISYLTAWPSAEVVTSAHQQITQDWWTTKRSLFDLFVSDLVREEVAAGDEDAASRRLGIVESLPSLAVDQNARQLARILVQRLRIPARAAADGAHIAIAVANGMDYLLTWNCRHIANARLRTIIEDVCASLGYSAPVICTPEELMEDDTT
jgi:hypothetical protein